MKILEVISEDVESQRAAIQLSQMIVDYINANPQLARAGASFKARDIPEIMQWSSGRPNGSWFWKSGAYQLVTDAEIKLAHLTPGTNGLFRPSENLIVLNVDRFDPKLSRLNRPGNPNAPGSTFTHEIQHALDYYKGVPLHRVQNIIELNRLNQQLERVGGDPARLSGRDQELYYYFKQTSYKDQIGKPYDPTLGVKYHGTKNYVADPIEINARLSQALDDFRLELARNPKMADYVRNDPLHVIEHYFRQNDLLELFPKGLEDPAYKRLVSRAGTFINREITDPSLPKKLVNPSFKQQVIGFITGIDPKNPAEILPRGSAVAKTATRNTLRVLSMPDQMVKELVIKTLSKSSVRTLLKSIPYIGWGLTAIFAADRLLKGDKVGAGLEVASGAGSFVTAIPTMATICARDMYGECYKDPDTGEMAKVEEDLVADPEGTKKRLAYLADLAEKEIKSKIDTFVKYMGQQEPTYI